MQSANLRRTFLYYIFFAAIAISPRASALGDRDLLQQASGQLVGAFQYMWHLQNSECGYLVKGSYGLQAGLDLVEKHLEPAERIYIREYFASIEWQLEDQQTYFIVMSSINAPEFNHLTKNQRCNQAHVLAKQLLLQSRQQWEHAVRHFSH